jgi:hypothetical protein
MNVLMMIALAKSVVHVDAATAALIIKRHFCKPGR